MNPSAIIKSIKLITLTLSIITVSTINAFAITQDNQDTSISNDQAFTDIEKGQQYYVSTQYLKQMGVINGYDDGSFKPNKEINRAEALKMLMIASLTIEELDEVKSQETPEEQPFTDTPSSEWYIPYLLSAKQKNVINGYDDGSFKPYRDVNLVETLKIYMESLSVTEFPEINEHGFIDTNMDKWYGKYIALASQKELLDIYPSGKIYPEQKLTRGYLADIIYKMQKSNESAMFGKATFYGKALQGNKTASGEIFDYNLMTAAHKTLPLGTIIEVTNMANGKQVTVKVNDRGPYGHGRVVDLSSGAFEEIAWLGTGIINIEYKIVNEE